MAKLKLIGVFSTDHDLKLARQDYFTSKQDKVVINKHALATKYNHLNLSFFPIIIKDKFVTQSFMGVASDSTYLETVSKMQIFL